jgi:outer membrane protein OmpA-like peptidoglycan-associated protein
VGNDEANRSLSEKRAEAVAKYLISKGISTKNVSAKGYGESKPTASNDTEKGRMMNRRVECRINI